MINWYGIETEAAFRQRDWERQVVADARVEEAIAGNGRPRGWHLPHVSLATLRSLATPPLRFVSPLIPRRRTAAC